MGPAKQFEGQVGPGVDYGTIQGVSEGDSVYYRPN
jgi:hypothetical protein